MEGEINKQLGGLSAAAARAGSDSGRGFIGNFGSNLVSGLDSIGGTITKWAGRGFLAAGAAAGAVIAAGLWGGMQRALDREDAMVAFRRMGLDDRNIRQLTDSIDQALRGTPVTNPEGFGLGVRFLAAGVEPAEIARQVGLVADMAKVANRPFDEMADVMARAQGAGRIMARELYRMGDLPLGMVAAELGMTESQLRDTAAAGELSAEKFFDAFAAVEAFSGAAKDPTTRVAFQNLRTAVSALGEQFLSPLLGEGGPAQRALLALRENVSGLGPVVADLGQRFSGWLIPAIGRAADFFTGTLIPAIRDAAGWFDRNRDTIGRIAAAVGPAVAIIGALATSIHLVTRALRILGMTTPVGIIMALAAGLIYAWQNSETFRRVVTGAFDAVKRTIQPVIDSIGRFRVGWSNASSEAGRNVSAVLGGFTRFGSGVRQVFDAVLGTAGRVRDVLSSTLEAVRGGIDQFVTGWRNGASTAGVAVSGIIGGLTEMGAKLRVAFAAMGDHLSGIRAAFSDIWTAVQPAVLWIGERLPGAFRALWAVAGPIVGFLVTLIGDTLRLAISGVVQVFQGALSIIEGILNVFAGLFTGDWRRMWEGVKQIASGIFNAIVGLVKTWLAVSVFKVIGGALKAITGLFTKGWSAIRSVFSNAGTSITSTVRGWVDTVRLHIWQAMDRVRALITSTWQTIRTIFQGGTAFIRQVVTGAFNLVRTAIGNAMTAVRTTISNAMTSMRTSVSNGVNQVGSFFRGLPRRILDILKNLPRMLLNAGKDAGRALLRGLTDGIRSMGSSVTGAVGGVLSSVRNLLPSSPAKEGPFSGRGWTLYSGRSIVEALADGIEQRSRLVEAATASMAAKARAEADFALSELVPAGPALQVRAATFDDPAVGGPVRGGRSGPPIEINVQAHDVKTAAREVGAEVGWQAHLARGW